MTSQLAQFRFAVQKEAVLLGDSDGVTTLPLPLDRCA